MSSEKVLVIAGRGYFGQLLIDDLLRNTDCELTVSGQCLILKLAEPGFGVKICLTPFRLLRVLLFVIVPIIAFLRSAE